MGSLQSIIINQINDRLTKKGYDLNDFTSIDQDWVIIVTHIPTQETVKIRYKRFEVEEIIDESKKFKKYIRKQIHKLIHKIQSDEESLSSDKAYFTTKKTDITNVNTDKEEKWIVMNNNKTRMILPKGIKQQTNYDNVLNGFSCISTKKEMRQFKKQNPSIEYAKDNKAEIAVLRDSLKIIDRPQRNSNDRATNASQTVGRFITRLNVDHCTRKAGTGNPDIIINPNIYVFIVDTGIDKTHPELNIDVNISRNFVGSNTSDWEDYQGHGTHVAGIVGARDNGSGIVGVAPNVKLVAIRVLDANGSGYYSDIISALNYILTWKRNNPTAIVIVNMSLGGPANSVFDSSVRNLVNNNILVVVAAGNEGRNVTTTSPARVLEALTIGAYNPNNNVEASWSNFGTCVDLQAPGVNIDSTYKGTQYAVLSGTSMASPMVAGAIACLLTKNPGLTTALQIRNILVSDAVATTVKNYDNTNGSNPNITLTRTQSNARTTRRSVYVGKY